MTAGPASEAVEVLGDAIEAAKVATYPSFPAGKMALEAAAFLEAHGWHLASDPQEAAIRLLEGWLAGMPKVHHERAGVIRAIEILRVYR